MSHKRTFDYDYCYGKQNEEEVLKIVNEYFEDDAETTSKFCKYDFKGKNIYELKSRNIKHDHMQTTIFPVDKLNLPKDLEYEKYILLFKFTDGLYFIEYDKKIFDKFGVNKFKRQQRADNKKDVEKLYYFIPVVLLKHIESCFDNVKNEFIITFD